MTAFLTTTLTPTRRIAFTLSLSLFLRVWLCLDPASYAFVWLSFLQTSAPSLPLVSQSFPSFLVPTLTSPLPSPPSFPPSFDPTHTSPHPSLLRPFRPERISTSYIWSLTPPIGLLYFAYLWYLFMYLFACLPSIYSTYFPFFSPPFLPPLSPSFSLFFRIQQESKNSTCIVRKGKRKKRRGEKGNQWEGEGRRDGTGATSQK